MQLRDQAPKFGGSGRHRECAAEATLQRINPHFARIGITRIADITGLDRIGIPVYNAIIPRSQDDLSVYNGKGVTVADALASAVMEAVERFSAWLPMRPERIASVEELTSSGEQFLDPLVHNMMPHPVYNSQRQISWVRGVDLLNERSVLLPLFLAGYYVRFHEVPCYKIATSNGIASGNTLEEAVCHALMEVLERDDWTMADLVSHRLKRTVRDKMGDKAPAGAIEHLEDKHRIVDPSTLPPEGQQLVAKISAVGARVVLRDIRSESGLPGFAAVIAENLGPTVSPGHAGYGSHPDAGIAALRAITEAAQSRVVDIQGMREDLSLPGAKIEKWNQHTSRGGDLDVDAWPFGSTDDPLDFTRIQSFASDDIRADIDRMLEVVRLRGLDRAIAIDLSPPGFPVHVARMVVPGLEQWSVDQGKLGTRATATWDAALKELMTLRDRPVPSTV